MQCTTMKSFDSGCELDGPITQALIVTIEDNCSAIYGNFTLSGNDVPSHYILQQKFGTATAIHGEVAVIGTDFTDLSFLGNLTKIYVDYDLKADVFVEKFLRIEDNDKLERLGWDALQIFVVK
ncbi:hypothetical protein OSTOST_09590 [Ostertagia ostertagi]